MKTIVVKIISILLVVTMVLTGCNSFGNKPTVPEEVPEVTVINVMHRWPQGSDENLMGNLLLAMFEDFEAKNPDLKIQLNSVPSSMYESQLTVRLAAEDGPDVYILWPGGRVESQVRKGDILDITDLWQANNLSDIYKPGVVAGSTHTDGRFYTLPIESKPNTFWYNQSIFDEVGALVPETWEELMAVAETCKEAGYVPFAVGGNLTRWMPAFWFDYLLLNTAGGDFRERLMWGQESWTSDEVYKVFELWKEAIDLGYFNPNVAMVDSKEATEMIANGEAAMMLQGPWAIPELSSYGLLPLEDFNLFAFPSINPNIMPASEGATIAWCINPNSDAIEASKKLLTYMSDFESMKFLSSKRNTLGPRKDIGMDIYTTDTRAMMEGLNKIITEAPLYMNFELATLPTIQDAGMDGFIEFMGNPSSYKDICEKLEAISRETFDQ